jgi:hypothetical protein
MSISQRAVSDSRLSKVVLGLSGSSRPLGAAKRLCMIRVPRRVWLAGLGLAVGITLTAEGSTSADAQSRSPNANVVDELLAQLGANPRTSRPSSVPTCSFSDACHSLA